MKKKSIYERAMEEIDKQHATQKQNDNLPEINLKIIKDLDLESLLPPNARRRGRGHLSDIICDGASRRWAGRSSRNIQLD